ncbi:NAD(P)(+) transhydrogenase (Re/Si-specific) subunit alpha [Candidatus Gromoviella agglomerans]|uniref:NAD(P)(+) transhydrogenase (Re/Si-specific) subunit alpha n=1 Tax=Candidatus Gromoviella agglomerans TaxID=2806609 RepID=UPI001E4C6D9D|nr:NAD(P)(+) transhydrogenase (Re/Si-specific) subunit alpha [Candidatus Gromoviella agglomerans]
MKIVILNTSKRVAIIPNDARDMINNGHEVFVESSAGDESLFYDEDYKKCSIFDLNTINDIGPNVVIGVKISKSDLIRIANSLREPCTFIFAKIDDFEEIEIDVKSSFVAFSLDMLPRITRAQDMDVLSSQNNLLGYVAAIKACELSQKVMPMMNTSAGRIHPAKVIVIGAGVAGLQCIATFKRMGAIVYGCDVRENCKDEVESLGAKFFAIPSKIELSGGYVTEISQSDIENQRNLLRDHISDADIVICSALIRGKVAPIIITKDMVKSMKNGALIIDLAIEHGGNCELSQNGITKFGKITILGSNDLIDNIANEASKMLSKNNMNFLQYLFNTGYFDSLETHEFEQKLNEDEILKCMYKLCKTAD